MHEVPDIAVLGRIKCIQPYLYMRGVGFLFETVTSRSHWCNKKIMDFIIIMKWSFRVNLPEVVNKTKTGTTSK